MKPATTSKTNRDVENKLLLSLVRPVISKSDSDRIRSLLRQELDWDYLLTTAHQHRVTPILHDHLKSSSVAVPEEFWNDSVNGAVRSRR